MILALVAALLAFMPTGAATLAELAEDRSAVRARNRSACLAAYRLQLRLPRDQSEVDRLLRLARARGILT